ncbi:MAG: OmpH family outer membrane protein [Sphingomonadales bacterium]
MTKFLLFTISIAVLSACSSPDKPKKDSTPKVPVTRLDGLKIAYYANDSVKKYFDYFKREEAAAESKQKRFERQLQKLNEEYEAYLVKKDQEARAGLLSQNEIAMVQQKAQQMQANAMEFQQKEGARIETEINKSLEAINRKVEVWGKKYSEKHHIDLLLIQGQGGQFNFINPSMDVTKEFINFLNENQSKIEKEL